MFIHACQMSHLAMITKQLIFSLRLLWQHFVHVAPDPFSFGACHLNVLA